MISISFSMCAQWIECNNNHAYGDGVQCARARAPPESNARRQFMLFVCLYFTVAITIILLLYSLWPSARTHTAQCYDCGDVLADAQKITVFSSSSLSITLQNSSYNSIFIMSRVAVPSCTPVVCMLRFVFVFRFPNCVLTQRLHMYYRILAYLTIAATETGGWRLLADNAICYNVSDCLLLCGWSYLRTGHYTHNIMLHIVK